MSSSADWQVERGGDEAGLFRLLRERPRLRLVRLVRLDFEFEQQPREAEAPIRSHTGDTVGVEPLARTRGIRPVFLGVILSGDGLTSRT